MYLQCAALRTTSSATIVFYALCLLYILSTASFVSDFLTIILKVQVVSNNSLWKNIIFYQLCRHISVHLLHYEVRTKIIGVMP